MWFNFTKKISALAPVIAIFALLASALGLFAWNGHRNYCLTQQATNAILAAEEALDAKDDNRAIEYLTLAIDLESRYFLADQALSPDRLYFVRAEAFLRKDDPDAAIADLSKCLHGAWARSLTDSGNISDVECLLMRGRAYLSKKDTVHGNADLETAIMTSTRIILNAGQTDQADRAQAHWLRAEAYSAKGDEERAKRDRCMVAALATKKEQADCGIGLPE